MADAASSNGVLVLDPILVIEVSVGICLLLLLLGWILLRPSARGDALRMANITIFVHALVILFPIIGFGVGWLVGNKNTAGIGLVVGMGLSALWGVYLKSVGV